MRKVALIYNPASGRVRADRVQLVRDVAAVFEAEGIPTQTIPTAGPHTAGDQARDLIAAGCDTIVACGGDGTVNEVSQGLIGTDAALGILPLGTANALAADLCLPHDIRACARKLLEFEPNPVAAGHMQYVGPDGKPASRYFVAAAGVGADAHLMYKLNPGLKNRFGMGAYYLHATWIWATHSFSHFEVEYDGIHERVTQLLAIRISQFGGLLRSLAPGAALGRDDLRLVLFKTRSRTRYLAYVLRGMLDRTWSVPGIELVHAREVKCHALPNASRRIYGEADGELLGTLPVTIRTVPAAIRLLMPKV